MVLIAGGNGDQNQDRGPFYLYGYNSASYSHSYIGCRHLAGKQSHHTSQVIRAPALLTYRWVQ